VAQALVRQVGLCPPGTYVRLDNQDLAVVLRRTERPNLPLVASLIDPRASPTTTRACTTSPRATTASWRPCPRAVT
jgi:hypothetical protein